MNPSETQPSEIEFDDMQQLRHFWLTLDCVHNAEKVFEETAAKRKDVIATRTMGRLNAPGIPHNSYEIHFSVLLEYVASDLVLDILPRIQQVFGELTATTIRACSYLQHVNEHNYQACNAWLQPIYPEHDTSSDIPRSCYASAFNTARAIRIEMLLYDIKLLIEQAKQRKYTTPLAMREARNIMLLTCAAGSGVDVDNQVLEQYLRSLLKQMHKSQEQLYALDTTRRN